MGYMCDVIENELVGYVFEDMSLSPTSPDDEDAWEFFVNMGVNPSAPFHMKY